LTAGLGLLVYLALMILIPYASTSEEHAAARGLPFNARALVERAKAKYAEFASNAERHMSGAQWRQDWHRTRAEWRAERRRMRDDWRAYRRGGYHTGAMPPPTAAAPPAPVNYLSHLIIGAITAVIGLAMAGFTVLWILVVVSFVQTGTVLGIALPHDMPWWLGLVLLIGLYQCVAWPIHHVRRSMHDSAGYYAPWAAAWNGVIAAAVIFALFWYGIHHQSEVRSLLEQFWHWWQNLTGHHAAIDT
jgi:hypothetical protein